MNYSKKLINVNSRQLFAFLEICRLQSFAKVAEHIHMSPSGLSMLVKELEEQLGARLFDRTTRALALTNAARTLQPVAQQIVDQLVDIGENIRGSEHATLTRIRIAATPMISASLLPRVIHQFSGSHPKVRIQLSDVHVDTVRSRVLEGEADIGLGFFVKPAVGLLRQAVCRFRLMRISPPGSAASALGTSRPWTDLAGMPLIALPSDNPIQALIEHNLARIGRAHEDKPTANLMGTLIGMVEAGVGHAVVPSFALGECLRHGLSVAMLVDPAVHLDLYLISRKGSVAKPAVAAFAAALKQAASKAERVAAAEAQTSGAE